MLWKALSSRNSRWPEDTRYFQNEAMLQHARALFHAEEAKDDLQSHVAWNIGDIRHFDVENMERVVSILPCGRSGSFLLTSYLDGHDDVLMLPLYLSTSIYEFYDSNKRLSLLDKLITYPVALKFFEGDFSILAANYYAAVKAVFKVLDSQSLAFLESSRSFFLFLHVTYSVALGRLPATRHPLIVFAQHTFNSELAKRLVEDFPQARFIHTVRDPLTNCGRSYPMFIPWSGYLAPAYVVRMLGKYDEPHAGMQSRTRAVRFEDLHLNLKMTMETVADWLGLRYQPSLLESTFNGVPWVVERESSSWSGPRPEQAARDARNISFTDKGLLFAVLNEDFVAWNYPCHKSFKSPLVRVVIFILVFLVPMRIEIIETRRLLKNIASLRRGRFSCAVKGLVQIFICRLIVMALAAAILCRRLVFGKHLLRVFDL
jgi:hypothetical protein